MSAAPPLPQEDLDHVLAHTRGLWEEARGQAFFITGGTGFFGMWLLESFAHINDALGLGMRATVLTRDPARFAAKAPHLADRADLSFLAGDVRSFAFPGGAFPYVIHAATETSSKQGDEAQQELLDAIIGGTRRTLDFAAQAGTKKFLLTSSGAVYGRQPGELTHVPESYAGAPDPLLPASAYGEGKRISEHMCAVHARRFGYETKIARCFAFVGPHLPLDAHFAIGNFIRDAMRGGPIQIGGDGTPCRSYLYASDLVVWLWTILFRGPGGCAYNVGSGESLSIREAAEATGAALGLKDSVRVARAATPGQAPSRYVPEVAKARCDLGLEVLIDLTTSVQKTVQWCKKSN